MGTPIPAPPSLPRSRLVFASARIHLGGSSRSGGSVPQRAMGLAQITHGTGQLSPRTARPPGASLPSLLCQAAYLGRGGHSVWDCRLGGGPQCRVPEEWEPPSQAARAESTRATAQRWVHPKVCAHAPPRAPHVPPSLQGSAPIAEQARAALLPAAAGPDDRCLAEPRNNPASI